MILSSTLLALSLALAPEGADPTTRVLTQLLTVELGSVAGLEVLNDRDINRVLGLEKQRAVMGCGDADACLAELADAMGARLVVYGDLSLVGERYFLSLNLFDSEESKAVGRLLLKGANLAELEQQIEGQVAAKLLDGRSFPPGTRAMVLEVKGAGGAVEAKPVEPGPTPAPAETSGSIGWIWISSGVAMTVVGLAAATPSAVVPLIIAGEEQRFAGGESAALDRASGLHDAWYGDTSLAPIGAVAGGVLVAAGVGLVVIGFVSE